jgi:hypothetical protein
VADETPAWAAAFLARLERLESRMATKDDLAALATKDDLASTVRASEQAIRADLRSSIDVMATTIVGKLDDLRDKVDSIATEHDWRARIERRLEALELRRP